ncbi:Uncharacterised protein [Legionella busanensis]|uniref:Cupin type-2 domain-containing protein n=1 Tax=Legionella busanensis TaxID=190655 RepID=A0A378JGJ7_9GAMM|nr:cupin domain-containing protein [Legionella busanensis]STX50117.1 Uncharacterised protein [Legionella busanensis]
MKYFLLFTGSDQKSYFKEESALPETEEPLGSYSSKIEVDTMRFRTYPAGKVFPMHTAPTKQFIIYQEGEVEVEASGGETKIFKAGDVLFATDTTGTGHISRTLTAGRAIIITVKDE